MDTLLWCNSSAVGGSSPGINCNGGCQANGCGYNSATPIVSKSNNTGKALFQK